MRNYQRTLYQEQPDPDMLAAEVAGIAASLTILQILIDGNDETQIDKRLTLDFVYSQGEHLRRISDDLSECGRIKRALTGQLDKTKEALNDAQALIDSMTKTSEDQAEDTRDLDQLQKQGEAILHETGADLNFEELQSLYNQAEQTREITETIARAFRIGVAVGRGV